MYYALFSLLILLAVRFVFPVCIKENVSAFLRKGMQPLQMAVGRGFFSVQKKEEPQSDLEKKDRTITALQSENQRLRKLLSLKKEMTQYETVACEITGRAELGEAGDCYINKGSIHGIIENSAVVTPRGLAGVVSEVWEQTSRVTPITREGVCVGIKHTKTQGLSVAEGIGTEKELLLSLLFDIKKANAGDAVETSGAGGIYPEGILVGTIKTCEKDGAGNCLRVTVQPAEQLSQVREVLVIYAK